LIRDDSDYENHINYIHNNPVKHGYVNKTIDWPYSTLHDYIARGVLPFDWDFDKNNAEGLIFGETV
jgi:REP-associated tyrosine transposase